MSQQASEKGATSTDLKDGSRIVALLVAGALFMELLDGTMITTALPAMGRSFKVSAVLLNAGVVVYLFALAIFHSHQRQAR